VECLDTTFAALSDPTRRAMVERLARGPASVHGLTEPFALSQQMISKHIACLVRAQLVMKTKRGRESICTLRPEAIKTVSDWAIGYRQFWEESFDKLEVVVNRMKKAEARDDKKHGKLDGADGCHQSFRCPTRTGLEGVDRPEIRNAVVGAERL
jgi:DNA-binding transcriptional ArsR family regulator